MALTIVTGINTTRLRRLDLSVPGSLSSVPGPLSSVPGSPTLWTADWRPGTGDRGPGGFAPKVAESGLRAARLQKSCVFLEPVCPHAAAQWNVVGLCSKPDRGVNQSFPINTIGPVGFGTPPAGSMVTAAA